MAFDPGYGETPIDPDEAAALTPKARVIFGDSPKKLDLYEVEQAISDEVGMALLSEVVDGSLTVNGLLTDTFLRELHLNLFGDLWSWAGRYRTRALNIGVAPEQIAAELRASLSTIDFRWKHTTDWTARELGIVVHAETVRIHGFVDGNGRSTRLLANLVFLAAQEPHVELQMYDWGVNKTEYIELLHYYDVTRDPKPLAEFVPVRYI